MKRYLAGTAAVTVVPAPGSLSMRRSPRHIVTEPGAGYRFVTE